MPRLGIVRDFGEPGVSARRAGGPTGWRLGARGMMPLDLVLDRLEGVRQQGEGYQALCPAHDDRDPSLSVAQGEDGQALLKCFAGCETEEVVVALGLEMKDLFEHQNGHEGGGSSIPRETASTDQPVTLENYAAYLGLPVGFLKNLGLKEYRHLGDPAVSM